eukprot:NODE_8469_length_516_cov_7.002141_g7408_i0.p3 GENE.NODE_8469_length_516_cov_7.002141_g7408_i0~~NODE_8469_length_516_cov_7.002141_g7408_i0.p3  ORF type:complete len:61 (+),score=1.97 NODE_8469_length_516_cov_7.002141_g7408_i0:331-513(+)
MSHFVGDLVPGQTAGVSAQCSTERSKARTNPTGRPRNSPVLSLSLTHPLQTTQPQPSFLT